VRRRKVVFAASVALGLLRWPASGASEARVAIKARKFAFEPAEIRVARGRPVTLVLTSVDFPHGFALPDFGTRCDLIPGKPVEVNVLPNRTGHFYMLCDNFCGEEHDKMSGWFIVEAPA
jgi:cytochrome c oxidase subunit 2